MSTIIKVRCLECGEELEIRQITPHSEKQEFTIEVDVCQKCIDADVEFALENKSD